jgi:hypothetical protein
MYLSIYVAPSMFLCPSFTLLHQEHRRRTIKQHTTQHLCNSVFSYIGNKTLSLTQELVTYRREREREERERERESENYWVNLYICTIHNRFLQTFFPTVIRGPI